MFKSKSVLVALSILAIASVSFAKDQGPIIPSNPPVSANAGAAALAGSLSNSSAGSNSHSSNYNANDIDLSGAGSSAERSYYLSLPQPVTTIIPQSRDLCVLNESSAAALGWNFVSGSGSKQIPNKVCYVLRMAEEAEKKCQFATADFLTNVAFNELFPSKAGLPPANRQNQIACLK